VQGKELKNLASDRMAHLSLSSLFLLAARVGVECSCVLLSTLFLDRPVAKWSEVGLFSLLSLSACSSLLFGSLFHEKFHAPYIYLYTVGRGVQINTAAHYLSMQRGWLSGFAGPTFIRPLPRDFHFPPLPSPSLSSIV
jgi:hypothetical protein